MGFFAEFSAWLDQILRAYITDNTRQIATLLEPAVVTLGALYIMVWGMLQIAGQVEEPILTGLKRIAVLALIFGVGIDLWLYDDVIVNTFYQEPGRLAAGIVGSYDSVGTVDQILISGDDTANLLFAKGGILHGLSFELAGFAVEIIVGFTAVYVMFLLSLSRIALSILLALGPLFIAMLFFESTKRFVEAWLAQLANYGFVAVLTVLSAALMLTVLSTAAQKAVATGGGITIADAIRVCLAAGLTLLVLRQVMPMAAALASGVALSSFGSVSGSVNRSVGVLGQFGRGLFDRDTSRWDPASRRAGHYAGRAALGVLKAPYTLPRAIYRASRQNSIRSS
jgi:type IV secretion system protein VirB6